MSPPADISVPADIPAAELNPPALNVVPLNVKFADPAAMLDPFL